MREATVEGRNWYSWLQRNMHVWAIGFHAHAFSSSSEKIPAVSANSESVRPALICDESVLIEWHDGSFTCAEQSARPCDSSSIESPSHSSKTMYARITHTCVCISSAAVLLLRRRAWTRGSQLHSPHKGVAELPLPRLLGRRQLGSKAKQLSLGPQSAGPAAPFPLPDSPSAYFPSAD